MAGTTFVALLRGINVGGRTLIRMAALRELIEALGFEDVETYIQSGNVIFDSPDADAKQVARRIEEAMERGHGLRPAVILRTPRDLGRIAKTSPFLAAGAPAAKLHVVFLDRAPAKSATTKLDPDRSPGDEWSLRGRDLYLHLPEGAGRSKLTLDYLERTLGVRGTQRSWKTVLELAARSAR
jgi:uncharacterized protein (DUF1697 family)